MEQILHLSHRVYRISDVYDRFIYDTFIINNNLLYLNLFLLSNINESNIDMMKLRQIYFSIDNFLSFL